MEIMFEIEKRLLDDGQVNGDIETVFTILDIDTEEDFGDIQTVIDRDGNFSYGIGNDVDGHRLVKNVFIQDNKNNYIPNFNSQSVWKKISQNELRDILSEYMDEYYS